MSESDIALLTTLLMKLSDKLDALNAKCDAALSRIEKNETDILDLFRANTEVRIAAKACKEQEDAKLGALTSLVAPAVDLAQDTKVLSTGLEKVRNFIYKNWKWIVLPLIGAIGAKWPEVGKLLNHAVSAITGMPPSE